MGRKWRRGWTSLLLTRAGFSSLFVHAGPLSPVARAGVGCSSVHHPSFCGGGVGGCGGLSSSLVVVVGCCWCWCCVVVGH